MNGFHCFFSCDFFSAEIFLHKLVACFGNGFHQHFTELFYSFVVFFGNFNFLAGVALAKAYGFHIYKVKKPYYCVAAENRNNDRTYTVAEHFVKLFENVTEACFGIVALVDEERSRNVTVGYVSPCDLRSDFNARFCVYNYKSRARNTKRLNNFSGKIKISGSVDYVYFRAFIIYRSN